MIGEKIESAIKNAEARKRRRRIAKSLFTGVLFILILLLFLHLSKII